MENRNTVIVFVKRAATHPVASFLGFTLVVTFVLVNIITWFSPEFSYIDNLGFVISISIVITWLIRRQTTGNGALAGLLTKEMLLWIRKVAGSAFSIAWLMFFCLMVFSCLAQKDATPAQHFNWTLGTMGDLFRDLLSAIGFGKEE